MARNICMGPCDLSVSTYKSFTFPVPGFPPGYGVKAPASMSFEADCEGCSLSANFLLMIQPLMLSLGLPLCLLTCLLAMVGVAQKLVGQDGAHAVLNADPTLKITLDPSLQIPFFNFEAIAKDYTDDPSLIKRIVKVLVDCACLFDLLLPFKWICMIKALVMVVIALVNCVISLLNHLITLELRLSLMLSDPDISIQKSAVCLAGFIQVETSNLAVKLDVITQLFKLVDLVFKILTPLGVPTPPGLADVQIAIDAIVNMIGNNPVTATLLTALQQLKGALEVLYCALNAMSFGLCPMELDCSACGAANTSGFQASWDGAFPVAFADGEFFEAEVDGAPVGTVTILGQRATAIGAGATYVIPPTSVTVGLQPAGNTFEVDSVVGWSVGDAVVVKDGVYVLRTTIASTSLLPDTIELNAVTTQALSNGAQFIKPARLYIDISTPSGTNTYSTTFDVESNQVEFINAINSNLIGAVAQAEGAEIRISTEGYGSAYAGLVHGTANPVPSSANATMAIGYFGAGDFTLINPGPNTVADLNSVLSSEIKALFDAAFPGSTVTDNTSSIVWASDSTGSGSCVRMVTGSTGTNKIGFDWASHCGTQC